LEAAQNYQKRQDEAGALLHNACSVSTRVHIGKLEGVDQRLNIKHHHIHDEQADGRICNIQREFRGSIYETPSSLTTYGTGLNDKAKGKGIVSCKKERVC
jgi:hypothetical protein